MSVPTDPKAHAKSPYLDSEFLSGDAARPVRILAEYPAPRRTNHGLEYRAAH